MTKRQVESMHASYDTDPADALARALAHVLDVDVEQVGGWEQLLELAGFEPARAGALRRQEVAAMDELFRELNEMRGLDPYPRRRWIGGGS